VLRFFGDILPLTSIIIKVKEGFYLMIDQSFASELGHDIPRQEREESRKGNETDTPIREHLANLQKIFELPCSVPNRLHSGLPEKSREFHQTFSRFAALHSAKYFSSERQIVTFCNVSI
jgi:hypothetical protein